MVSLLRKARSAARRRRNAGRENARLAREAFRAQNAARRQPSSQPRDGRIDNVVLPASAEISEAEFRTLSQGQAVYGGVVRSVGIDPQWPMKLIRLYKCWWQVSYH